MSTYTSSLGLELITPGSQAGLWGNTTNNTFTLVDQAITGVTPISFASAAGTTYTLTDYNGAADEARSAVLNVTGIATGSNTVVVPNKQKTYLVRNNTGQDVTFQTPTATTPTTVAAGYNTLIFCDGNNGVFPGILVPGAGTLGVSGGGTGKTTFATAGFLKTPGGTGDFTSSATVNAATELTGITPVANGGTGANSFTSGGVLLGNGSGALSTVTASTVGYVLTWNGSQWQPQPSASGGVTSISGTSPIVVTGTTTPTISLNTVPTTLGGTGAASLIAAGIVTTGDTQSISGAKTFTSTVTATGSNGFETSYGGYTGHLTSNSVQLGGGGIGFYWDGTQINVLASGGVAAFKPGGIFQVGTEGYKPGGGLWAATSDARLKTGVAPLSGALDKICMLNPVTYDWKINTKEPTVGFIAQDVKLVIPTAVCETDPTDEQKQFIDDNKLLSIGWKNDMMAYLVGAIQELKAEVDALKAAK